MTFGVILITADDASIGLLAFCLLMWATLPWAFSEPIEKFTKKPEFTHQYSHEELESPRNWLSSGATDYSISGFFYLLTILIDLAKPSVAYLTDFLSGAIFVLGTLFFVFALYYTRLVINFVLKPDRLPNTFIDGLELKTPNAIFFSVIWFGFDLLLLSLFSASELLNPSSLTAFGKVLYATTLFSLIGMTMLIVVRKRERSNLNGIATLMMFSPIVVILYVAFGGLL